MMKAFTKRGGTKEKAFKLKKKPILVKGQASQQVEYYPLTFPSTFPSTFALSVIQFKNQAAAQRVGDVIGINRSEFMASPLLWNEFL
ncbi:hypothetical protein GCM10010969_17250 [Saccharibacillus kuerlensis]|uniref:Uncharacterized protein n=1 Tax=Saccharibacillus kuerlensis TaxID=459527 RepID=A0ABQ2L0F9_9BACL|nr:hypothetical protein GCM10010969_17250 [Saccharibacillus kuerlensis]